MHLTPNDLNDPYMVRDLREETEDCVVTIEHHSLERGELTVHLEPGQTFELTNDEPTKTIIKA